MLETSSAMSLRFLNVVFALIDIADPRAVYEVILLPAYVQKR